MMTRPAFVTGAMVFAACVFPGSRAIRNKRVGSTAGLQERSVEWHSLAASGAVEVSGGSDSLASTSSSGDAASFLMYGYVVPCAIMFVVLIVFRPKMLDAKLAQKEESMNKLQAAYDGLVGDLQSRLQASIESNIELIQTSFNSIRKDFNHFWDHVAKHPKHYPAELLPGLKEFTNHWFETYVDCKLTKHRQPSMIAQESEVNACSDIHGLGEFMVSKLSHRYLKLEADLNLVKSMKTGDGKQQHHHGQGISWIQLAGLNSNYLYIEKPDEDGWPCSYGAGCCGVTLFSPKHAFLLCVFIAGPIFAAMQVFLESMPNAALVLVAQLCILIILIRFEHIDELARLEMECLALQKKNAKVEENHQEMMDMIDGATTYMNLWMYRSIPTLRLMKAVMWRVRDEPERGAELLQHANTGFRALDERMGAKHIWYAQDGPSDEVCKDVRQLVNQAEAFVVDKELEDILKCAGIFDPLCRLKVRLDGAHGLHHGSFFDKSDPYAQVRVGDNEWSKTETVKNSTDPRWTQNEFSLVPGMADDAIHVQVFDDDSSHSTSDEKMGECAVKFRDLPVNTWTTKKYTLTDAKQGEVEISVHRTGDLQSYVKARS